MGYENEPIEVKCSFSGRPKDVADFFGFLYRVPCASCTPCTTGEMDYPLPDTPEDKKPFNPATPPPGWRVAVEFARDRERFGDPNNFERK